MALRYAFIFGLFFSIASVINAQGEKIIISDETAASGSEVCLSVSVEGFTNINEVSMLINTSAMTPMITFVRGENYMLENFTDANIIDLGPFGLGIGWQATDQNTGVTLPDGSDIFDLCFTVMGNPGESVDVIVIVGGTPQTFFGKTNDSDCVPEIMNGSVTIPDMLTVVENNISPDNCFEPDNGAVEITVSGGTPPYTFEWSDMSTSEDLSDVPAGNYSVTVTDSSTSTQEVILSFIVPDMTTDPMVDVGSNNLLTCTDNIISIGGTQTSMGVEFEYTWIAPAGVQFISGQNDPMAEIDQPGEYTLRVINTETGCETSNTINVTEDRNPPNVNAGADAQLPCNNNGIVLTAENDEGLTNLSASWSTDDGSIDGDADNLNITALSVGTYSVTLTNEDNSCTSEDAVSILEPDLPSISIDGDIPMLNCDIDMVEITVLTDAGIDVSWTTTDGQIVSGDDTNTVTVSSAGLYQGEATDPNTNCTSSIDVEVLGNTTEPTVDAGLDLTVNCIETIVTLEGTTDTPDGLIEWTDANGNSLSSELMLDANRPGSYFLNVTNEFGCLRSDEVLVVADTMRPVANAGADFEVGCIDGQGIALDGSGSSLGTDFTYMWSTSNGTLVSDFNSTMPIISAAGTYDLVVTNSQNGCSSLSSVVVSLQAGLPLADAGADFSTCENTASLTANLTDMISGEWTTTSSASIDNASSDVINVSNLSSGENAFIWTLSTADCADYSRDTVIILLESAPNAIEDIQSIPLNENTISFNVLDNDNTSNNDGVSVSFPVSDPNFTDLGDGLFTYTFPDENTNEFAFTYAACSEMCPDLCDEATVTLTRQEPSLVPVDLGGLLPNVITPNGDGLNDALVFDIMLTNPLDFPNPELTVFNRWGDVVYRQQPYDNSWQGTNQTGSPLPEGTYYFINRLDLAQSIILSGDVTIIRD